MQPALNKLESICKRLNIAARIPKIFLPIVCEFASELFRNPSLKPIVKKIKHTRTQKTKLLNKLEKLALSELRFAYIKIEAYVKTNLIDDAEILRYLSHFEDPSKILGSMLVHNRFSILRRILLDLPALSPKHINFVQEFGYLIESSKIDEASMVPKFCAWENEYFNIQDLEKTADWHSLHEIELFFEAFDRTALQDALNKLREKNQDTKNLIARFMKLSLYDIDSPTGSNRYEEELYLEELNAHAQRLFNSIEQKSFPERSSKPKTHTAQYTSYSGLLEIDTDNPLEFNPNLNEGKLLEFMTKCYRENKPRPTFVEVFETLFSEVYEEIYKNKFKLGICDKLDPKHIKWIRNIYGGINRKIKSSKKPNLLLPDNNKLVFSNSYKII